MRTLVSIALVIISSAVSLLIQRAHPSFNAGWWCGAVTMIAFSVVYDATAKRV